MTTQLSNADIYAGLRTEFVTLARSLSDDELSTTVPQCPAWSVKDVAAHVTGIVDDILAPNLDGIGTEAWTDAQVAKRAAKTIEEICVEWEGLGPAFRQLGEENPVMAMRGGADLITHYHDVMHALGRTGERDTPAVRMGLERYGPFFCERAAAAGLPIVRVVAGEQVWQSADGEPAAVLTESAFELMRAFSGRRSLTQVRAMNWTGDAAPYLAIVSPYGLPADDVVE